MLVLEEVLLVGGSWIEELSPLAYWGLEGDFVSVASVSFLLAWKDASGVRLIDFSNLGLFSSAPTLATISSICSLCWTKCFQVRLSATPIWGRSEVCKLWWHVSTRVALVIPLGHQSAIFWNLFTNALTNSPFRCLVVRRVDMVISESSSKKCVRKRFSRSPQFLMKPSGSFMNHSKAIPFKVPMNKRARMASFDTTFPVWDWSSICAGSVTLYHRRPAGLWT